MRKTWIKLLFGIGIAATAANLGLYLEWVKYVAVVVFLVLFIIAIINSRLKSIPNIFKLWLVVIIMAIPTCLFHSGNIEQVFQTSIPLMIAFSSTYLFHLDEKQFLKWFLPLSFFISYCAVSSVIKGVGSFTIADSYIYGVAKNQICPFFAIVSAISFSLALQPQIKIFTRLYLSFTTLICICPSICLLNRTSIIAFVLVAFLVVYARKGLKGIIAFSLILSIILIISGSSIINVLYDSIIGQRDASDLNSLTSGRVSMNREAMNYIADHILWGEVGTNHRLDFDPHLYLLNIGVRFGLITGLPFYILYISIIWLFIKAFKNKDLLCIAVLLIALLESLSEYASPFGPGTTYVFCYIIVGVFIYRNHYKYRNFPY